MHFIFNNSEIKIFILFFRLGSGKSSLLYSLLGEMAKMNKNKGEFSEIKVEGKVAYVS